MTTENLTPEMLLRWAVAAPSTHEVTDRDFVVVPEWNVSREDIANALRVHADAWAADKARLEALCDEYRHACALLNISPHGSRAFNDAQAAIGQKETS